MLIAAGVALVGDNRGLAVHRLAQTKSVAGEDLPPGFSFVGVRLASALFGGLGAVLFFQLMLTLTGRPLTALALSNLYLFENAFIVQFRAAQLDAFQTVFVLLALLIVARGVRREAAGAKMGEGLDFASAWPAAWRRWCGSMASSWLCSARCWSAAACGVGVARSPAAWMRCGAAW
jgi:4-amino-4-deoxy-L-arabinose transferase-like glycosyltransferase